MLPGFAALALAGAPVALAAGTSNANSTGGAAIANSSAAPKFVSTRSHPMVAGTKAKIINGVAYAPSQAPLPVQQAIWAGNKIRNKPYVYGGGHGSFNDSGYDCSGSVSFVLHAARRLGVPYDSGEFMSYGRKGTGKWITVFGSDGHAFVEIAGIVLDTAHYASTTPGGSGPRWQRASIIGAQLQDGNSWSERHPAGL